MLAYEKNDLRRKIREVVEIMNNKETVNFKSDSGDMYTINAHVITES